MRLLPFILLIVLLSACAQEKEVEVAPAPSFDLSVYNQSINAIRDLHERGALLQSELNANPNDPRKIDAYRAWQMEYNNVMRDFSSFIEHNMQDLTNNGVDPGKDLSQIVKEEYGTV